MLMSDLPITGEVSNSKLVAVFDTGTSAQAAANAVHAGMSLQHSQVQVLLPGEPDAGRKLEPENRGIWRTIVIAHIRFGIVGAVVGGLLFALLIWLGVAFIVQSPWAAGLVLVSFGTLAGLLVGGLVALRPDHDLYIQAARAALANNRAAVVIHAFSRDEAATAGEILRQQGGEVTSTF